VVQLIQVKLTGAPVCRDRRSIRGRNFATAMRWELGRGLLSSLSLLSSTGSFCAGRKAKCGAPFRYCCAVPPCQLRPRCLDHPSMSWRSAHVDPAIVTDCEVRAREDILAERYTRSTLLGMCCVSPRGRRPGVHQKWGAVHWRDHSHKYEGVCASSLP
jgi:hypothetical protein